MAHFHIPTVFLILGFLLLLMPTITWLVLADRQSRPIGLWCGGGISIGVGVVLVALRGQLPAWATFPLAGLMIFLCIMMQIQSMRMDLGMPCHMAWIFAPALLYVLGVEVIRLGLGNLPLVAIYNHTIFFAFSMYLAFLAWRIGQRIWTQEAIFKRSDQAMYQAKEKGRNRVQVYEPEIIASLPPS